MKKTLRKLTYFVIIAVVILVLLLYPHIKDLVIPARSVSVFDAQRVLILDPGHGGEDGGAVSLSGVHESVINLDITKRIDLIMGLFGTEVVLTRDAEELIYPDDANTIRKRKVADTKRRAELINSIDNAVLISIHQNIYPGKQPFGAQVFYSEKTPEGKDFAVHTQTILRNTLNPNNKRQAVRVPKDVYLLNNIDCTAILIECGFLSNPEEDALLQTDRYKLRISWAVACAYLSYFGGINED
ncbi:MAG TPA: N-acetylmuramoyl-L-alanine amidase [Clostridiales bacterium]|jgi:N-acetylmuramoyl-L-alanine amidase|nr:N-acetylmuramoyl-L-alanine amidase [Clostridiales bacterium]